MKYCLLRKVSSCTAVSCEIKDRWKNDEVSAGQRIQWHTIGSFNVQVWRAKFWNKNTNRARWQFCKQILVPPWTTWQWIPSRKLYWNIQVNSSLKSVATLGCFYLAHENSKLTNTTLSWPLDQSYPASTWSTGLPPGGSMMVRRVQQIRIRLNMDRKIIRFLVLCSERWAVKALAARCQISRGMHFGLFYATLKT